MLLYPNKNYRDSRTCILIHTAYPYLILIRSRHIQKILEILSKITLQGIKQSLRNFKD